MLLINKSIQMCVRQAQSSGDGQRGEQTSFTLPSTSSQRQLGEQLETWRRRRQTPGKFSAQNQNEAPLSFFFFSVTCMYAFEYYCSFSVCQYCNFVLSVIILLIKFNFGLRSWIVCFILILGQLECTFVFDRKKNWHLCCLLQNLNSLTAVRLCC